MVDELYVVPEHRGQGIGRRALQFIAEQADTLGARVLLLEVSRSNERAKRLYRSVGFEDRGYHLMKRMIKST
jgi:ribosomal protein S18 acetylase RimI-like enzyme